MDVDDMIELCFELWSRQFLAGYRQYVRHRFPQEHEDPKPQTPRTREDEAPAGS
jgi:hypothetical protein